MNVCVADSLVANQARKASSSTKPRNGTNFDLWMPQLAGLHRNSNHARFSDLKTATKRIQIPDSVLGELDQ